MKIALSLLKNYIDIDLLSVNELSDIFTLAGIEVEYIENEKASFSDVISVMIEEVSSHPQADKLKIAKVSDGIKTYQVVCGAPNCRVGMKTAFAREGAFLTDDEGKPFQIKKCKIKEIESFGMLCSKKELKIAEAAEGIIELPKDLELGKDLSLILIDPIFEISLTPNLGHCMSFIGLARELSAIINQKLKAPKLSFMADQTLSIKDKIKIQVTDKKKCPRYSALYIEKVQENPSPLWLSNYLEACGFRSINVIVDVMNFVMLELGQPLHAFDYDKLEKQTINVCSLLKEEAFKALDGVERKAAKDSLVIEDGEKIVALAGIIGEESSAVSSFTKSILIEAALFNPLAVRKTSRLLNLRTESSSRFEKGIDPNLSLTALKRVASLLQDIFPNCRISKDFIDLKEKEFEKSQITCRLSYVNKIIGLNLSLNELENIFKRLDFNFNQKSQDVLEVKIPTYRNDLKIEIDLVEEVAKIYGYNNIPKNPPLFSSSTIANAPLYTFENQVKNILVSQGMQELITCDLISARLSKLIEQSAFPTGSIISVLHAKSEENSILRPSFLPSFLQVVKHNHDHKNFEIKAFEIGKTHYRQEKDFIEQPTMALVLCGKDRPHHWKEKPLELDFYDLKGIIENLFTSLKITNYSFKKSSHPSFHPGRQANIFLDDQIDIGVIGEIHPHILSQMDLKQPVLFGEINHQYLLNFQKEVVQYKELPQFPASERDWTLKIKEDTDITAILKKIKSSLLEKAFILDLYTDPKKSEKEKNITLRFIYRDLHKTVSYEEVEKEHLKIITGILDKLKD